jgi:hypothetical protein
MKIISAAALLMAGLAFSAGCSRQAVPKPIFKATIDGYFQAHPACLWAGDQTFPVKATTDTANSNGYTALADQGLLTRTAAPKHQSTYAISAMGQPFWVSDANHPGAGNLCYGHRQVVSIDNASQVPNQPGYSSIVSYHYTIADAPAWISAAEIQAAFPKLSAAATPQMSIATLTDTNSGWQMNPPPSVTIQPTSAANEPAKEGGKPAHKTAAMD